MKRHVILLMIIAAMLTGCKKEGDPKNNRVIVMNEKVTDIDPTRVEISGTYSYLSDLDGIYVLVSGSSDMADASAFESVLSGKSFTADVTGLKENTNYYYRYRFVSMGTEQESEAVKSFTTIDYQVPEVTTAEVTEITGCSMKCGGEVTDDGYLEVTARGVCWGTSPNPTVSDPHTTDGGGTGVFTSTTSNLEPGVKYYIRAYATNSRGTGYGNEREFTTLDGKPIVTTSSVTNIMATTATCGGEVTDDGGFVVTERGVCWSTSQNPTVADSHTTDGGGTGSFTSKLTELAENTTYYVRAYATNSHSTGYGEQRSFKICHEYVDLGLPSGLLWATCNVGSDKPEDYGSYFAWGETTTKSEYNWSTYRWCNGSYSTLTKYCTKGSYGTVDNKTVLEPDDDAARANWGGGWRMPTIAEMHELRDECNWTWAKLNGVSGYRIANKSDNNKFIFLPATGYYGDGSLYNAGSCGYYWSSSLNDLYPYNALRLYFDSSDVSMNYGVYRCKGKPVRPVLAPQK